MPESSKILSREEYEAYFKEPGTFVNRNLRYFKSSVGKKQAFEKLMKLIGHRDFINIDLADRLIDWNERATVIL